GVKGIRDAPLSASQIRTLRSTPAVTRRRPSGANANFLTGAPWLSMIGLGLAARSQTRAVRSSPAVTTRVPSGLNDADQTMLPCQSGDKSGAPVTASQRRAVPSPQAASTRRPSGLNEAPCTAISCFKGGLTGVPVTASHTRAWAFLLLL